jgi:hypothetical protein
MNIRNVHHTNTAMQRFWEGAAKTPPVSLVGPADVAPYIALESDADAASSLESVIST